MSDVETFQEFAEFQAARLWSHENGFPDVDETFTTGRREPSVAKRWFLAMLARGRSPVGDPDVDISQSAQDESLSDFEVLDELRTPKGRMQRQIEAFRQGGEFPYPGASPYRERLARWLNVLLNAYEEEGETWAEHSPDSLRQMLLFLQTVGEFRCPTVSVTPSATFRAQWQAGKNEHFAVDFLPDGQVRFVIFAPDPRLPDRVQRVSGVVSRADVMRVVEPYRVHRWAADAGT